MLAPEYGGDGGKTVGVCAQKQRAGRGLPGALGAERPADLPRQQVPDRLQGRRVHRLPRLLEPRAGAAGRLQRGVPADGGRQGLRDRSSCSPTASPAPTRSPARRRIARPAWPSARTARCTSPTTSSGRIWRVTYQGGNKAAGIASAAPAPADRQAAASGQRAAARRHSSRRRHGAAAGTARRLAGQVALGDRIFHGQAAGGTCAGCHGADGKGTAVGSDLAERQMDMERWQRRRAIAQTIEHGVPKPKDHTGAMPPMGGVQLSQADVAAVADYVWALAHSTKQSALSVGGREFRCAAARPSNGQACYGAWSGGHRVAAASLVHLHWPALKPCRACNAVARFTTGRARSTTGTSIIAPSNCTAPRPAA